MRIVEGLFSTKVFGLSLVLLAVSMAAGTFIENDYSTETAKALVYNARWFEFLLMLIAANLIGNISKYRLFRLSKLPILVFHLAFILIIIGAGVTRYRGQEGMLSIKEGSESSTLVSYNSYLRVALGNGHYYKNFPPEPLLLSEIGSPGFEKEYAFESESFKFNIKRFVPRSSLDVVHAGDNSGATFLQAVVSIDGKRMDYYIRKGDYRLIDGVSISFENDKPANIRVYDSLGLKIKLDEDGRYLKMKDQERSFLKKGMPSDLLFKSVYEVRNSKIVFAAIHENAILKTEPLEKSAKNNSKESVIWLEISHGKDSRTIPIWGGNGYMNPPEEMLVGNTFVKLNYGSIAIPLPFSVYLKDFELQKYPGSENPASFASYVEIRDNEEHLNYHIFMNHVLDYKGYRLFQSAYFPDESGTILSVNQDYWGTMISYAGYLLMGLGMITSLFWNGSFFRSITNSTFRK